TDSQQAVIVGATVTITNVQTGVTQQQKTDEQGVYIFDNLGPGNYSVRAEAPGFKPAVFTNVNVRSSATTTVDITLEVGTVSEMVMITAGDSALVNTAVSSARLAELSIKDRNSTVGDSIPNQRNSSATYTPRLRQDFPETLVWQPSLITDKQGRAQLEFKVADAITTWRMAVIGSTEDGLIGSAVADLRAMQPFLVEHQPPPSLTIGDEIETPVVARNYSDKAADVQVKLPEAPWMKVLSAEPKPRHVESQGSATEQITFRATAAGEFRQEASAIGEDQGDR